MCVAPSHSLSPFSVSNEHELDVVVDLSRADYKVVSQTHLLKPTEDQSLVDKAKQATGLSDDIEAYIPGLPVVAFMFSDEFKREYPRIQQRNVQLQLRQRGFIAPNYSLPSSSSSHANQEVLRVVMRETFHEDLGASSSSSSLSPSPPSLPLPPPPHHHHHEHPLTPPRPLPSSTQSSASSTT